MAYIHLPLRLLVIHRYCLRFHSLRSQGCGAQRSAFARVSYALSESWFVNPVHLRNCSVVLFHILQNLR